MRRGGEHLLDSNIDWGQDLLYLKDWLDEHTDVKLDGLAFFGSYPATLAGIPETPYPPPGPAAMAGYSIYIYHITPDDANRVRRKLGLPEISSNEDGL